MLPLLDTCLLPTVWGSGAYVAYTVTQQCVARAVALTGCASWQQAG